MVVLDTCAAVDMVRETPDGKALSALLLSGEPVITHEFFQVEVSNAFWKYGRGGMLDADGPVGYVARAIALVDEFYDAQPLLAEALREAVRLDHSVYDMLYFILARRTGSTLFTLDKKLQNLCLENGVNCVYLDNEF